MSDTQDATPFGEIDVETAGRLSDVQAIETFNRVGSTVLYVLGSASIGIGLGFDVEAENVTQAFTDTLQQVSQLLPPGTEISITNPSGNVTTDALQLIILGGVAIAGGVLAYLRAIHLRDKFDRLSAPYTGEQVRRAIRRKRNMRT